MCLQKYLVNRLIKENNGEKVEGILGRAIQWIPKYSGGKNEYIRGKTGGSNY